LWSEVKISVVKNKVGDEVGTISVTAKEASWFIVRTTSLVKDGRFSVNKLWQRVTGVRMACCEVRERLRRFVRAASMLAVFEGEDDENPSKAKDSRDCNLDRNVRS
jgi:hypothetical protein